MSDLTRFRDHCRQMADDAGVSTTGHLWTRLADEIDAYLAAPTASVDLFGDMTAEPATIEESEPA